LSSKGQRSIVLGFAFFCIWLSFFVLVYLILFINQQQILSIQIDFDKQLIESFIGWELTKQITWAVLIFPCLVGFFFVVNRLKEKNSNYKIFLLTILYLGFVLTFEYCVLKLIWSFQLTKKYETLLGTAFVETDPIQSFLFINTGAITPQGIVIVAALLGITAVLFFQLPQFGALRKERPQEEVELVGKAHELVEEKLRNNNEDLNKVKGIGPMIADKLVKVGIKSLADLANSDSEKVAGALDISNESANVFINVANSLIKAKKTSKKLRIE
jgi:hypothetical protein